MPTPLVRLFVCVLTAFGILPLVGTARAGIVIGNPPQVAHWVFHFTDPTLVSMTTTVVEVDTHGCDGSAASFFGEQAVDFAAGWDLALPEGDPCGITLHLSQPLVRCNVFGCSASSVSSVELDVDTSYSGLVLQGIVIGNPPMIAWKP